MPPKLKGVACVRHRDRWMRQFRHHSRSSDALDDLRCSRLFAFARVCSRSVRSLHPVISSAVSRDGRRDSDGPPFVCRWFPVSLLSFTQTQRRPTDVGKYETQSVRRNERKTLAPNRHQSCGCSVARSASTTLELAASITDAGVTWQQASVIQDEIRPSSVLPAHQRARVRPPDNPPRRRADAERWRPALPPLCRRSAIAML